MHFLLRRRLCTLRFALLLVVSAVLTTVPAQAQQQDAADRAEQLVEQQREQREAEMRERMKARSQETQARICRNAAPPAPGGSKG